MTDERSDIPSKSQRELESLLSVASALSRAPTTTAVVDAVLAAGLASLEGWSGAVCIVEPDGKSARLLGHAGHEHSSFAAAPTLPLETRIPIVDAVRTCEPQWIESLEELLARYPGIEHGPFTLSPIQAVGCAPLLIDGRAIGAIALAFDAPRRFDARDRRFLVVLAQQCALALERARLHDVERAARAAELLRDEYLARVSHELRTPLAAMRMWLQVLRTGKSEDRRMAIDAIDKSAMAQAKLIGDLLDLARGVNGKLHIAEEILDVRAPIEDAVSVMRPEAEAKSILLLTAIASDAGYVCGDPARIHQIVANLLSNAIKFTPRGGRIEVLLRAEQDDVVLSVSDTGCGVEPLEIEAIFAPFQQRDAGPEVQGGLGLGLTIARHLVELHRGSIRAESPGKGQGATFIVRLPRMPDEEVPPSPSQKARAAAGETALLAGVRVLLVDDHAATRDAIAIMLKGFGAEVLVATNGREAFEIAVRSPVGIIVSDIAMPEEDGCAFMSRLRARGVGIPAVALTAYARPEDLSRARAAGFDVQMVKPVESQELVDVLARMVGKVPTSGQARTMKATKARSVRNP